MVDCISRRFCLICRLVIAYKFSRGSYMIRIYICNSLQWHFIRFRANVDVFRQILKYIKNSFLKSTNISLNDEKHESSEDHDKGGGNKQLCRKEVNIWKSRGFHFSFLFFGINAKNVKNNFPWRWEFFFLLYQVNKGETTIRITCSKLPHEVMKLACGSTLNVCVCVCVCVCACVFVALWKHVPSWFF